MGKIRKKPAASSADHTLARTARWMLFFSTPLLVIACLCLAHLDTWPPRLRHAWHAGDALNLVRLFGGALLAALAWTVILPVAHWLRRTPMERFASGNRALWYVPMLASTPLWLACYGLVPLALVLAGWSAWIGLSGLGVLALLGLDG